MSVIRLIVGLGNIGADYVDTRHNAGFAFVDLIANQYRGSFSFNKKLLGSLAKVSIDGVEVLLLKPSTLMNLSGLSVSATMNYFKISAKELMIVHDELDLLPGIIKLKDAGGLAGHNGLKSIASQIGTQDFLRLRIGIGHPRQKNLAQDVADYVLSKPSSEDFKLIQESMGRALSLVPEIIDGNLAFAASQLNEKTKDIN